MKKLHQLTLLIAALFFGLPSPAPAKKAGKLSKDPAKAEQKALRKAAGVYDTNANGSLEGDEIAAVKKAFETDKTGPFKSADLNADGLLDDTEVAALHPKVKGVKRAKTKKA
ncbi:MAG: hypothetical protein JWL59_1291 [Chthoniobacteraceae bacterium]|nr:hypothetical protein [Chthoniobacteraceae bacterium]